MTVSFIPQLTLWCRMLTVVQLTRLSFLLCHGPFFVITWQFNSDLGLLKPCIGYQPTLLALLPSVILLAVLTLTFLRSYPDGYLHPESLSTGQGATLKPSEPPAGSIE